MSRMSAVRSMTMHCSSRSRLRCCPGDRRVVEDDDVGSVGAKRLANLLDLAAAGEKRVRARNGALDDRLDGGACAEDEQLCSDRCR